jgi:hypothetical protein
MEPDLDKRYQTILTLWAALLMSVVMYFIFMQFIVGFGAPSETPNPVLLIVMIVVSALLVLASFFVKARLLQRSVEKQDTGLVQKAVIVACAMCEVSAILGIIAGLVFSSRISYLLFFDGGRRRSPSLSAS